MIINNYHNKRYVETTDNEIIFYRWYGKKVLYKDKIRAAYMQDDYVVRILYGNAIRSYNICNIKNAEKIKLKEFIDSLNNENLIFSAVNNADIRVATIGLAVLFFSRSSSGNIIIAIGRISTIIGIVISIIQYPMYNMFIYDYKNKIITIESGITKKKKEIKEIGKDILNIKYDKSGQYIIKMKFNSIILHNNIMYPINYLEAMKEVYENHDLDITYCYNCGEVCDEEKVCSKCGKKIK